MDNTQPKGMEDSKMKTLVTALAVLCLALSTGAFAQTINATLGGTVSDATGALIPGVTITATNRATGIVTTVLTNEAGAYNFASIQSGTYRVGAELPGDGPAVVIVQHMPEHFTRAFAARSAGPRYRYNGF